jgi:RHS repeat-associated protein
VQISPGSQEIEGSSVAMTITWIAPDGLGSTTRRLYVNGYQRDLSGWTYTPNATNTSATSTGNVGLGNYGSSTTVTAKITNNFGQESEVTVIYTRPATRRAPVVSLTGVQNETGRNVAGEGTSLAMSTPSYVSLDQPRSVSLVYHSGQAHPTAFVQVNANDPSYEKASRFSLQVIDTRTNTPVTLQNGQQEIFTSAGYGSTHRLAAEWPMTSSATGDYKYRVVVRAYWADGAPIETSKTVRILVVNERESAFGLGWSMPGARRIHPSNYMHRLYSARPEGVILTGGDGTAAFYALKSCTTAQCGYTSPAGDFSTLVLRRSTAGDSWERTSSDGTVEVYNASGLLTTVTDRFGNKVTMHWGASPVAPIALDDPAGLRTTIAYNAAGRAERIVDPGGRATVLEYNGAALARARLADNSLAFEASYDARGRVSSHRNTRGTVTNYAYTTAGADTIWTPTTLTATVTRRVQHVVLSQRKRAMTFHATSMNTPATTISLDSVYGSVADPHGHTTRTWQDAFGNFERTMSPSGDWMTSVYDASGLPVSTSTKEGTTTFEFNTRGEMISQSVEGQEVFRAWYSRPAFPDSTKSYGETTHFRYGTNNALLRTWSGLRSDSAAAMVNFQTDTRGRVTLVVSAADNTQKSRTFAPSGWQNTSQSCERRQVRVTVVNVCSSYEWDSYGRTTRVSIPDGGSVATTYDELGRVRSTNENGRVSQWTYQGPDVLTFTDPAQKKHQWQYDAFGRVTVETDPEGRTRTFAYNAEGLLVTRTNRLGGTVSMVYDDEHRMTRRTASAVGTVPGDTTHFSYLDDPATLVVRNGLSTDTLRSDPLHGGLGRQVTVRGAYKYTFQHHYDPVRARLTRVELDASAYGARVWGGNVGYGYDDNPPQYGFKYAITSMSGKSTGFSVGHSGLLGSVSYPSGQSQQYSYDASRGLNFVNFFNRNGEIDYALTNATSGRYYYDELGRLSSRREVTSDAVKNFGYDLGGNLTSAGPETFTYDAAGNRTDSGAATTPGTNRYSAFDRWAFTYDAEGNLTAKVRDGVRWEYAWDALGRLARATYFLNGAQSRVIDYGYDGFGQRVRKTDSGAGTNFYLYHQGNLFAEVNGSQRTVIRTYTYSGTDKPVTMTVGDPLTGATYSFVSEQPGQVVGLLDGAGQLVNQYRYSAFGEAQAGTSEQVAQPLKYMGRELDATTGLYYVRARWYDPEIGRFISEDPIGLAGGINTYAYTANDPVNFRDPSGLMAESGPGVDCSKFAAGTAAWKIVACYEMYGSWLQRRAARRARSWDGHLDASDFGPTLSGIDMMVQSSLGHRDTDGLKPWRYLRNERVHAAGEERFAQFASEFSACYAKGFGMGVTISAAPFAVQAGAEQAAVRIFVFEGNTTAVAAKMAGEVTEGIASAGVVRATAIGGAVVGAGYASWCGSGVVDRVSGP